MMSGWDRMLALLQTQPDLHLATRDSRLLPEASLALGGPHHYGSFTGQRGIGAAGDRMGQNNQDGWGHRLPLLCIPFPEYS